VLTSTTSTMREVASRRGRAATALRHLGRDCGHGRYYDAIPLDIDGIPLGPAVSCDTAHSIDDGAQVERGKRESLTTRL
jgi:hypothetical protein